MKATSQLVIHAGLPELGEYLLSQQRRYQDIVILQPQWVSQYISKVLESEEVIVGP